jgi:hypothetical protein
VSEVERVPVFGDTFPSIDPSIDVLGLGAEYLAKIAVNWFKQLYSQ